jgi:hypothetical protein
MSLIISKDGSPSDRIANAFVRLAESAANLNAVSDDLGKPILALDRALRELNLGVTSWINCGGWENQNAQFEDHLLGYCKVAGKWGVALSVMKGTRGFEEFAKEDGEWLFNDAPRALRAEAVEKLPELIEALVEVADDTATKIRQQTGVARELAKAVTALAQAKK